MMEKLLYSICVPVYNVEKYLHECIDSVLAQTYANFELILVDDGSIDDSFQICKEYQLRDNRVKAFTKENGGQISAREYAFDRASGDVILCVDSDDFISNQTLEILNDYFIAENPDCIYFNWQRVCNAEVINTRRIITKKEKICDTKEILKKVCCNAYYNSMCVKAFKKDFVRKDTLKDFYKVRHGEDLMQTLGVLESVRSVLFVPDVLYNYRVNLDSVSYHVVLDKEYVEDYVRYNVYLFLKRKNLFSKKDWDDYGMYCAERFFINLQTIACSKETWKEKKEYFDCIRNTEYYKDFLHKRKTNDFKKNFFIALFEMKMNYLLIMMLRIVKKVIK